MLITRYIAKNLLTLTAFVVVVLTAVIWLTQSMKILELVANSDAPPSLFLKLVLLSLPRFLEIIMPLALVAAVLFSYNRLIADNELIVLRACGMDHLGLARPALLIAGMMTAVLLLLTTYISPKSSAHLSYLRQTLKAQYSVFLLREGVFNTFGGDVTVYLRKRDEEGGLYGLLIHDARDKTQPPVTITAKKGRVTVDDGVPTILVSDGMRQQLDKKSGFVSKLYFADYRIEVKTLSTAQGPLWHDAEERTLLQLFRPDMTDVRDRDRVTFFLAKAADRMVTPFNTLSFTLIALTAMLLGPFNRRGQSKRIAVAAVLVVLAQAVNLALVSLMKKNIAVFPALCLATFLPILLCPWMLRQKGEALVMRLLQRRWALTEAAA